MRLWGYMLVTLMLVASVLVAADDQGVTLEQLQSLGRKGSWEDVLKQIDQISPGERNGEWDALLEKASISYLSATASQDPAQGELLARDLLKVYPQLARSNKFMLLRNQNALRGFGGCLEVKEDAPNCVKHLATYVHAQAGNLDLAFQAGKLIADKFLPEFAFPFFRQALTPRTNHLICRDGDWKKSLRAALADSNGMVREEAKKALSQDCWIAMKREVEKEAERTPSGIYLNELCDVIAKKNQFSDWAKRKCRKQESAALPLGSGS